MQARLAERVAAQERQEIEMLSSLDLPFPATKKTEVLRKHIGEQTKKDATAVAHIIRTWLSEVEES
jgi:flagellar biosynthesis/type III secretory pathway M-ring protein FliF/YscJ